MPKGKTTTIRPEPVPDVMYQVRDRNVSTAKMQAVRAECLGTTFEKLGLRYQIFKVFRDDLRRLIAAGVLLKKEEES